MKLVLASRNHHKLRELRDVLDGSVELVPLPADVELPPETGETFAENARGKALAVANATGMPAIGEDSGIEAAALGGRPGVRSARYAGEGATDEQNLDKLLHEVPADGDRRVAYVCALVHATPDGTEHGFGGSGYDPAFIPDDYDDGRTMAELEPEQKHAISHRGRAARALREWLEEKQ